MIITNENEYYIELISSDSNGNFRIRVFKERSSQIQISTSSGDHDAYIDVDLDELKELRKIIDTAILSIEGKN